MGECRNAAPFLLVRRRRRAGGVARTNGDTHEAKNSGSVYVTESRSSEIGGARAEFS